MRWSPVDSGDLVAVALSDANECVSCSVEKSSELVEFDNFFALFDVDVVVVVVVVAAGISVSIAGICVVLSGDIIEYTNFSK